MSEVKPNYVRPNDLHERDAYCENAKNQCLPVIALADYETAVPGEGT